MRLPSEEGSPGSPAQILPLLQSSLPTQLEADWKHLAWLWSLLPAGSGQSDLQVLLVVPRVASVQVGAQCQAKDLALQSDPGRVEALRQ